MHTFINVYKNIKTSFFNSSENAQKNRVGLFQIKNLLNDSKRTGNEGQTSVL